MLNIDDARSYATEENLTKALAKLGLDRFPNMVVRNRAGRYTAIFSLAHCRGVDAGFQPLQTASRGFATFN